MIAILDTLFTWSMNSTDFILYIDNTFFFTAIAFLLLTFLINIFNFYRGIKKNKKLKHIDYKKTGKIFIHILLFVGILWRANYMYTAVQGDIFVNYHALIVLFTIIYLILRLIIYSYLIIIAVYIFRFLNIIFDKSVFRIIKN